MSAQKTDLIYAPPPCKDSANVPSMDFVDWGEHYFFGGSYQFEKFLYSHLRSVIKSEKITADTISLIVRIDSLGFNKGVSIAYKMNSCLECNELIKNAIASIDRWKPECYYSFLERKIICESKELKINISVKNRIIFLNGKSEFTRRD